MESFLVYLFNFYYAINELEQNKQNNTIIFFLLFIFLTKKWTSAVCGGVRAHPSHPPLPTGLLLNLRYPFTHYLQNNTITDDTITMSNKIKDVCKKKKNQKKKENKKNINDYIGASTHFFSKKLCLLIFFSVSYLILSFDCSP